MILILDYGVGNLLSIKRAYDLFEVNTKISNNNLDFENSSHLVLPGVGSFGYAMKNIIEKNLYEKIIKYSNSGRPIIGTCLGMQLLLESSEEFGINKGLNLIKGKVKSLNNLSNTEMITKPTNIGWQKLNKNFDNKLINNLNSNDEFYHVHSYFCDIKDNSNVITNGKFNQKIFPNIINKENIFGVQFHPEKSGKSGLKLIENFIKINY